VLIYTREDEGVEYYRVIVREVLRRMRDVGLPLDISKSEFETSSVKYLGFIVEVEKGVRIDPAKIRAILN
jgi:hypothetical protein